MIVDAARVQHTSQAKPADGGYAFLLRWLTRPRAALVVALLAFAMSLPAISLGLIGDDYDLAARVGAAPLAAYEFHSRDPATRREALVAARDAGQVPWWVDDDFHQAFMRPLGSLSLALDFALWPRAVWWMHVENSLLFAAIVLLVAALYKRLALSPRVVALATFFFAMNGSQSMTVAFIAARNTLLSVACGLLALWLYLRSEPDESEPGSRAVWHVGSVLALACALLSAEIGVSAFLLLLSYAYVLERGALRTRALRLLPHTLLVVGWQAVYQLAGYGASTSGFYRTPFADPLGFVFGLLTGLPIYLTSVLTVPFATLSGIAPWALAVASVLSLGVLFLMRRLFVPLLRDDRAVRFFAVGAALSVIPLGTTLPQDRLVFFINFGISGLLAKLIVQRLDRHNLTLPRVGARRLFYLHAVGAPLIYFPFLLGSYTTNGFAGGAAALEQALPRGGEQGVVLLNAPMHIPVQLQRQMREHVNAPTVPFVHLLYEGSAPATVVRTAARTLELDASRGYLASTFVRTARDPAVRPFHPGDMVTLPRMRVTVLEVTSEGAPKRVRFDFHEAMEQHRLMEWIGDEPRLRAWPSIGERIELPAVSFI